MTKSNLENLQKYKKINYYLYFLLLFSPLFFQIFSHFAKTIWLLEMPAWTLIIFPISWILSSVIILLMRITVFSKVILLFLTPLILIVEFILIGFFLFATEGLAGVF